MRFIFLAAIRKLFGVRSRAQRRLARRCSPPRPRAFGRLRVESLEDRTVRHPVVDDTSDSLAFDTATLHGTLRGAIQYANTNTDPSYTLQLTAGATYTLAIPNTNGQENANQEGDLDIDNTTGGTKTYVITTPNGQPATVNAGRPRQAFQVIGSDVTRPVPERPDHQRLSRPDDGPPGALPGVTTRWAAAS